ncbi:MAG: DUF1549 domain-containing protein, partial [Pirellulales bacterium]|nr:DUF1549 domain-containing protein [Pirellulales bacterium]
MSRTCFLLICVVLLNLGRDVVADDELAISTAAKRIDQILQASWTREGISSAPRSSDAEFCRRAWLDLAGVAPPVFELRQFLADQRDDKRARLVNRLLRTSGYASHMASRWIDILLPADTTAQVQAGQNVAALHEWLQQQFMDNTPYDYFVGGFLTAGGSGNSGPAIFYTSHSLEPEKLAAATSRIFMGIQLQCAQCHDHPFDRWTQQDFWQYAAFFGQLNQADGQMGQGAIIEDRPGGEVTLPDSDEVMQPRYPGISEPPEEDPADNRRRQLT